LIKNLMSTFHFPLQSSISEAFLDLSVLYWDPVANSYFPVTPIASQALVAVLRNYDLLSREDLSLNLLDNTKTSNERSKDFERALADRFLLKGMLTVTTTKLDGTDRRSELLRCSCSKRFVSLPNEQVVSPTLFFPEDNDFPVADLILVSPDDVVVMQVTFQRLVEKIPPKKKYSAIYEKVAFDWVASRYQLPGPADNLASSLLQLTDHPTTVNVDPNNGQLVTPQGTVAPFRYIIITSRNTDATADYARRAIEFPWIRVIARPSLADIFPQWFVDLLPNNT